MSVAGLGDRWIAGERIVGVHFELRAPVEITGGPHAGERGTVIFLMAVQPEPVYLIELGAGKAGVRVPQSALRPAA